MVLTNEQRAIGETTGAKISEVRREILDEATAEFRGYLEGFHNTNLGKGDRDALIANFRSILNEAMVNSNKFAIAATTAMLAEAAKVAP